MKIEGSIALVTGANRGLGKSLVTALLERGAKKVYACARTTSTPWSHERVVPLVLDTTKTKQLAEALARAPDVNLLINNAGVMTSFGLLTATEAQIEADLRTNLYGTLAVIKAFAPVLERSAPNAALLNVLSLLSLASIPSMGGYATSKAAAWSMTQALRAELRPRNVRVHAALAGPIDTEMVKALPLTKSSPDTVASAIVAGIARDEEDIFPDPLAEQMGALWKQNPTALERTFATF